MVANVAVCYFAQNDPVQSRLATRLIEARSADDPGFVSIVTLAEITWILTTACSASRDEIGKVVENLLQTQTLVVQLSEIAWKALAAYRKGVADYADCLIERLGAANECDATYNFDKVAARDAGRQLLSSR